MDDEGRKKAEDDAYTDAAQERLPPASIVSGASILCGEGGDGESMAEGTRERKLMIFSTMPTAAATSTPRLFAMAVMMRKEIWMRPS